MTQPIVYLLTIPAVIVAVMVHECTKAFVSTKLGDVLPKNRGRLTLNPLKHLEPIGFLCMLIYGYGWGKPMPTSALNYQNRKLGTVLTYSIPSLANIIVGYIFAFIALFYSYRFGSIVKDVVTIHTVVIVVLTQVAVINVKMALFNLVPIYPLDGAKVLSVFLHPGAAIKMNQYEKILQAVLVVMLFMGIVSAIFSPVIRIILGFMY